MCFNTFEHYPKVLKFNFTKRLQNLYKINKADSHVDSHEDAHLKTVTTHSLVLGLFSKTFEDSPKVRESVVMQRL